MHVFNYVVRLSGYHVLNFIAVDLQLTVQFKIFKITRVSLFGTQCSFMVGCDHIGHNDIGHNRKPYRPHGKYISATDHIGHKTYGEFITLNY